MNTTEITNRPSGITARQAALVAAVSLLIMFVAAMLAEFAARQSLIVPGDAANTAQNIVAHSLSFRMGLLGYMIVFICDALVTWALYIFFVKANQHLSMLAAAFRLLYTAISGAALVHLLTGYRLLTGAHAGMGQADALAEQALQSFQTFDDAWAIAMVFFGLHLLVLGYLVLKSGTMPRFIGVLLLAAAVGYVGDSLSKMLLSNYADYKAIFTMMLAIPGIIGEVGLAVWLLVKGGKEKATV